jgi:O-Antigen ligase
MTILAFLLGIFIALSPLTGARNVGEDGGGGVGVIDIALAFFSALFLLAGILVQRRRGQVNYKSKELAAVAVFWALALPLLAFSTLTQILAQEASPFPVIVSTLPFVVSAILVFGIWMNAITGDRLVWLINGFEYTSLAICLGYVALFLTGAGINIDGRFIGLSQNPNQTALHALCIVLISSARLLSIKSNKQTPVVISIANIVLGATFGLATQSDALQISFGLVAILTVGWYFIRLLAAKPWAAILLAASIVAVALLNFERLAGTLESILAALELQRNAGDQESVRVALWRNGLVALDAAPIIGHGTGAWSGIYGPFEGVEAHNSWIDWMTMTGWAGGCVSLVMILGIGRKIQFRRLGILSLFVGLFGFTLFHFVFRQPIFWLTICICVVALSVSQVTTKPRSQANVRAR